MTASEEMTVRVVQTRPPSWKLVREREEKIDSDSRKLSETLIRLRNDYDLSWPSKPQATTEPAQAKTTASAIPTPQDDGFTRDQAGSFSQVKLDGLRSKVSRLHDRLVTKTAELLSTPLGEKLPDSVVELLLSHEHREMLKASSDQYPLVGALLDVLEASLAEIVGDRIKKEIVAPFVASAERDPESGLDDAIEKIMEGFEPDWNVGAPLIAKADQKTNVALEVIDKALKKAHWRKLRLFIV